MNFRVKKYKTKKKSGKKKSPVKKKNAPGAGDDEETLKGPPSHQSKKTPSITETE